MKPIYTCATDVAQTVWCALPADIALIVPLRPIFAGSLYLLHAVLGTS